jgi:hypothetical protein
MRSVQTEIFQPFQQANGIQQPLHHAHLFLSLFSGTTLNNTQGQGMYSHNVHNLNINKNIYTDKIYFFKITG